jgi:hypothetical protein
MSIIPVLRRLRQKDHQIKANLGYIMRPCLKKKKKIVIISGSKLVYTLQRPMGIG